MYPESVETLIWMWDFWIFRSAGFNRLDGSLPPPAGTQNYITYVVQPEDTLIRIAQRYGTTYEALASLNDIPDPDIIYAGQTIRIPETGTSFFRIS